MLVSTPGDPKNRPLPFRSLNLVTRPLCAPCGRSLSHTHPMPRLVKHTTQRGRRVGKLHTHTHELATSLPPVPSFGTDRECLSEREEREQACQSIKRYALNEGGGSKRCATRTHVVSSYIRCLFPWPVVPGFMQLKLLFWKSGHVRCGGGQEKVV